MNTNKIKIVVVGAGLAVVSAAGVSNAFAASSTPVAPVPAAVQSTVDTPTAGDTVDAPGGANVQQGDQSAPDVAGSSDKTESKADAPGGRDVQQGDQSAPDVAGSGDKADSKTEAPSSEKAGVSDGPGGYADQGNSNADTQQEGEH